MKKAFWGASKEQRQARRSLAAALVIGITLVFSASVQARSLGTGLAHYADGDYVSAEKALKMALTLENRADQRMKIYKLLAISQYMLGKKSHAADNFRLGLRLKPTMVVMANEVVNEGVIGFFADVKSGAYRGSTAGRSAKMTRVSRSTGAPLKVWITSNAARGTISQKGKVVGYLNEPLSMPPGFYTLTMKADGYRAKEQIVKISRNRSTRINVQLTPIGGDRDVLTASRSRKKAARMDDLEDDSGFEADPFADMDYLMADSKKSTLNKKMRKKRKKRRKSRMRAKTANVSFAMKKRLRTTKRAEPVDLPLLFIPFGVGNYFAGSTLKAGLYGGTQVLFLAQFFQAKARAEAFEKKAVDTFQNSPDASDEDKQQFLIEADKYIKQEKQLANLGLLGFVATWGASAVDAYLTRPKPRRRRLTVFAPTMPENNFALGSTLHLEDDREKNQTNLSMGIDPFASQGEAFADSAGPLKDSKVWFGLTTEF